jgi:hypothetical protein
MSKQIDTRLWESFNKKEPIDGEFRDVADAAINPYIPFATTIKTQTLKATIEINQGNINMQIDYNGSGKDLKEAMQTLKELGGLEYGE